MDGDLPSASARGAENRARFRGAAPTRFAAGNGTELLEGVADSSGETEVKWAWLWGRAVGIQKLLWSRT